MSASLLLVLTVIPAMHTTLSLEPEKPKGCALAKFADGDGLGTAYAGITGVPALDVDLTLDNNEIFKVYKVRAAMFLLQEPRTTFNAFATPERNVALLRQRGFSPQIFPDGTVYLGLNLMKKLFSERRGFATPSVMGHEYAHILQFKKKFPKAETIWSELHADFLAGWYTAHRSRFVQQNMRQSLEAMFELGDDDFFNPDHHGTPKERVAAFEAGARFNFVSNTPDVNLAYKEGLKFIKSLGAEID